MNIEPCNTVASYKMWMLDQMISVDKINKTLGFTPNVDDDPYKVTHSWGFKYNGQDCAIWDFKGMKWSAYGPKDAFVNLFGEKVIVDFYI